MAMALPLEFKVSKNKWEISPLTPTMPYQETVLMTAFQNDPLVRWTAVALQL